MKITVGTYASTRGISEATAKKAIKGKKWKLERNPIDNRQRMLTLEQQAELDAAIPKANPPSAAPTVPVEVVQYDRPTEVGMILAERALVGEITYTPQSAVDNPLFQAIQQRVDSMKAQNLQITQQVNISMSATRDTAAAIDGLKQLEIAQAAEAQAHRDFQLKNQIYQTTLQNLELQATGLSPVSPPVAPSPAAVPANHSKSPF